MEKDSPWKVHGGYWHLRYPNIRLTFEVSKYVKTMAINTCHINQHYCMWTKVFKAKCDQRYQKNKIVNKHPWCINACIINISLTGPDISEVEWWRGYEIWHSVKERRIHDIWWKYQTLYLFYFIISILETKTMMWYLFSFYMHNLVKIKIQFYVHLYFIIYLFLHIMICICDYSF